MDMIKQFYETVKKDMTVILATAAGDSVTMRVVSPVYYKDSILIFTNEGSTKYKQMKQNPNCCISAGIFYAEATAEFMGSTMLAENEALRDAYCEKFPGAFDEGLAFGGRDADFVILHPFKLSGWTFENGVPDESGIPTVPFSISLK